MKLNNKNVNISEIAVNLSGEFGQFELSEGNALRLLFQRATDAPTAAEETVNLAGRLSAMGYDEFAVRFDSSGISIIDGRPLEVALDAWVTQEGGRAEEAARKIRDAFYNNVKKLCLKNFFLSTLPPILQLLDLTDLNLSRNQLTTFDTRGLDNLAILKLSGNQLTTFDTRGLDNLAILKLSGNQLTTFDGRGLTNLTNLDLSRNQLTTFDGRGLTNLTNLDLSLNQLATFDGRGLTNLTNLDLSGNQLATFDGRGLTNLTNLDLSGNQLATFHGTELTNLNLLNLNGNQLTTFDAGGLDNLANLYLSGNQLATFDAEGLDKLTHLNLSGNQLATFHGTELTNLNLLNLSGNQLTTFDAAGLDNLAILNLSENQLTTFDPTELTNLNLLNLSENQLTTFDPTELTNLNLLNLSENQLTTFDAAGLDNLTDLNLSRNQLTTFDAAGLDNLTNLNLSRNQLTTFDAAGLMNLIALDLANNEQLSNLPLALCQCTNLRRINRFGTQIPGHNCDTILAQCRALRDPRANPVLQTQLNTWISASRENFKLDFILEMTGEEKGVIHEWLKRLERTKDFTTNSQPALAKEVCSMLRDLELHPVFRKSFFAQVSANNEACEDRAGMAFNELFVSWRLATLPQNATEKEKLQLLVQPAKTLALRKALARTISSHGGNEAESVEIYLYYEKELKQRLQLLTAINNMRYTTIGWRDWIKEEELVATVNSTYIDELCELPQLKELALKDPEFAEQYHAMNEEFTGMLENLGGGISSQVYLVGSEEVSRKRAERERELLRKWAIPKLAS